MINFRFKPSDRKSHSLPRPYVLINGDTPLNVVKLLAGDPRYLEFDNFKIKKLERTIVSWLKEDHSDQFKSKIGEEKAALSFFQPFFR